MFPLSLKEYQEDRKERGVYDKRNPLNDLTGKEWLFSTKTVIPKVYPHLWPKDLQNPNIDIIPSCLIQEFIETFSKPNSKILDPFAGIGSTLIGTYLSNIGSNIAKRVCIGIEENRFLIEIYNSHIKKFKDYNQRMEIGNPIDILSEIENNSIDFIFTDIPVWDVFESQRNNLISIELNQYKNSPKKALITWLSKICMILSTAAIKLSKSKYLVIAIPNHKFNDDYTGFHCINFTLSSILAFYLEKIGLTLKSERIWFIPNLSNNNNNLRPLERRFLIFKREKEIIINLEGDLLFFKNKIPSGNTQIIHKAFPPSFNHKLRSNHGGMKPPELAQLLIDLYSKKGDDLILDPFAGVGGTLLGASLAQRRAIGIDINERWKEIYLEVARNASHFPQKFLVGDSRQLIKKLFPDNSIDLILTDVPYWAMDKLKKTRGRYSKAGEESKGKLPSSLKKFDHGTIPTIDEWLLLLQDVFSSCYPKLNDDKYLIVFIGNMYRTIKTHSNEKKGKIGKYLMLSSLLTRLLLDIGFQFKNEIIWYSPDKALHVFGYPFTYIPSVVHQNILIFKK